MDSPGEVFEPNINDLDPRRSTSCETPPIRRDQNIPVGPSQPDNVVVGGTRLHLNRNPSKILEERVQTED